MALSPEAIIAMIALFVACVPGLRLFINYYQTNIRRQNGIQNTSLSQPATPHPIVRPSELLQASNLIIPEPIDQAHSRPEIPASPQIDAPPSGPHLMGRASPRPQSHLHLPFYFLEPLSAWLRRPDTAIQPAQLEAGFYWVRSDLNTVNLENQRLINPDANSIDEHE